MYGEYVKERLCKEYAESKGGFAIWSWFGEDAVYIEDIYVKPEYRLTYEATELADSICENARKQGKKYLVGSVWPQANGSTTSLKVLLGYNMRLWKVDSGLIFFIKEL